MNERKAQSEESKKQEEKKIEEMNRKVCLFITSMLCVC